MAATIMNVNKQIQWMPLFFELAEVSGVSAGIVYVADRFLFQDTRVIGTQKFSVIDAGATFLSVAVSEFIHTLLDAYNLNPLDDLPGGSLIMGPGISGITTTIVSNADAFRQMNNNSSSLSQFLKGAIANIGGRYIVMSFTGKQFTQLPSK